MRIKKLMIIYYLMALGLSRGETGSKPSNLTILGWKQMTRKPTFAGPDITRRRSRTRDPAYGSPL